MSKAPKQGAASADVQTPEFWATRLDVFEKLYAQQQQEYAAKSQLIKITLPDGKVVEAKSWVTTPNDIAKSISNSLPDKCIVARVNETTLWDMTRPLEADCALELLDWDYPEAQEVFWHSSSHILGYALERVFGCKLSSGPPLKDGGFYYEGDTGRPVSEGDYGAIESAMTELVKQKAPYQRLTLTKETALQMFGYNPFKQHMLGTKVPEGGSCTVYKCGNLIDPCRGPHLSDTGRVKAFSVHKNSSSYFLGDAANQTLQRVYAISFPKADQLKEWKMIQEQAAKRDHRIIGRQQDLFYFHDVSPGSAFFFNHGARIYNAMVEFQRSNYRKRGFDEVISPNIYNAKLWQVSGHWQHYKDAMFTTVCEHEEFGLKPMNCPGHCVLFAARQHSYRELPIRFADFGALHRNELSGALTGLTRVRRFQQDDAHIFCRPDQIRSEIDGALDFLSYVYGILGFQFYMKLSTRPENALGSRELWDYAEARLAEALNAFCNIPVGKPDPFSKDGALFTFDGTIADIKKLKRISDKAAKDGPDAVGGWTGLTREAWELNPGDGAFYGPKIDIVVEDALKRRHQCATIQLDFVLPERFGLKFTLAQARAETESRAVAAQASAPAPAVEAAAPAVAPTPGQPPKKELNFVIDSHLEPNQERPVMIHRAIFGSMERCIAILCEHYGGKWPFWLSPRQVVVIPLSDAFVDYAQQVKNEISGEGIWCDVDITANTLDKKVRDAQVAQYNFILVVGNEELAARSVNVRTRDNQRHGSKSIPEVIQWFLELKRTFSREY